VFRTRPLVTRQPEDDQGEPTNQKKPRLSHDLQVNQSGRVKLLASVLKL